MDGIARKLAFISTLADWFQGLIMAFSRQALMQYSDWLFIVDLRDKDQMFVDYKRSDLEQKIVCSVQVPHIVGEQEPR